MTGVGAAAPVEVDRDWAAVWCEIVEKSLENGTRAGESDGCWGTDGARSRLGAGRAPRRRATLRARGSLRTESALRRFLLEALDANDAGRVVSAVQAMRSAGFDGSVLEEVRPYVTWP
jgi:hypothetical protein